VTTRYSAGGLVSTVEDLALWTRALHQGRVVKPESLGRMLSPVRLVDGGTAEYGYGLSFRTIEGDRLVGHGGALPGFRCQVETDPKTGCVAVILANTSANPVDFGYFCRSLLALGAREPLPDLQPVAVDPARLKRLCGLYTLDGVTREIVFENGRLFSHRAGHPTLHLMIPESDTEFCMEDSDDHSRFELAGDRVLGLHKRYGDGPEGRLCQRQEPPPKAP